MHVCAERGFHEIAKEIVERDRDKYKSMVFQQINFDVDGGGNTPLHVAIEWNSME